MYYTSLVKELRDVIYPHNFYDVREEYIRDYIRDEVKKYVLKHIDHEVNTNDLIAIFASPGQLTEWLIFLCSGVLFKPDIGLPRFAPYFLMDNIAVDEKRNSLVLSYYEGAKKLRIRSKKIDLQELAYVIITSRNIVDDWGFVDCSDRMAGFTRGTLKKADDLIDAYPCSAKGFVRKEPTKEEFMEAVEIWEQDKLQGFRAEVIAALDKYYGGKKEKRSNKAEGGENK